MDWSENNRKKEMKEKSETSILCCTLVAVLNKKNKKACIEFTYSSLLYLIKIYSVATLSQ